MPLTDKELSEVEGEAEALAWQAGRLLLDRFQGPLPVEYKDGARRSDPVTEVDRRCEAFLKEELSRRFPDHGVVGEEGAGKGEQARECTWVLDPLDGTTNYLNGFPCFACSIGLVERGAPVAGAIFVPWPNSRGGRVFHGRKGGGTRDGAEAAPVRLAGPPEPQPTSLVGLPGMFPGGYRLDRALRRRLGEPRALGSIAYEMCMIVDGVMAYGLFNGPRAWDVAAGIVLVQEAGGLVVAREKRGWKRFEGFQPSASPAGDYEPLRRWRAAVIVGNAQVARFVAAGLRPRSRLLRRLTRRVRAFLGARRQPDGRK